MTTTEQEFNSTVANWSSNSGSINTIDPKYALREDLRVHINKQEYNESNLRSLLQIKLNDLVQRKKIYQNFLQEEGIVKVFIMQSLLEIDDMIFILNAIIQSTL
jgi:hypothetical protein